eukprot:gene11025-18626_t
MTNAQYDRPKQLASDLIAKKKVIKADVCLLGGKEGCKEMDIPSLMKFRYQLDFDESPRLLATNMWNSSSGSVLDFDESPRLLATNLWKYSSGSVVIRQKKSASKKRQQKAPAKGQQKRQAPPKAPAKSASKKRQQKAPAKSASKKRQQNAPAKRASKKRQQKAPAKSASKKRQQKAPAKSVSKKRQQKAPAKSARLEPWDQWWTPSLKADVHYLAASLQRRLEFRSRRDSLPRHLTLQHVYNSLSDRHIHDAVEASGMGGQ